MKKYSWVIGIIGIAVLLFGGTWLSSRLSDGGATDDNPNISTRGIHWHSKLTITIRGEQIAIPANIGLGTIHNPIHTHTDEPEVIHMEFDGIVKQDNLRLKRFFEIWNKQLSETCLLDECGGTVTMRVNGVENTELGEYIMQDGDEIDISLE